MTIFTARILITILYVLALVPLVPVVLFSPLVFAFAFDDPHANILLRVFLIVLAGLCILSIPLAIFLTWKGSLKWALVGIPGLIFAVYAFFLVKNMNTPYENNDIALNAEFGNIQAVEKQLQSGVSPDGNTGTPPLLTACSSGNFLIAEKLIAAGANIFAYDSVGWTAGYWAYESKVTEGAEGEARLRVLEKMKEKGFPFPPPDTDEVNKLVSAGKWPPK